MSQVNSSKNNPYYYAFRMILNRLLWDMNTESWISKKKIKAWKNRFNGKKAVILCNGPSLLNTDFKLLNNIFTFGLNKINLLFDKTNFRPSCIVSVNPYAIEQNAVFLNETQIPIFLHYKAIKHINSRPNTYFLHSTDKIREFARDCTMSIYSGSTVTFVAMQLAYFMGFTKVALVGCDHYFVTKGEANKVVISGKRDDNHFDPNYFANGMKWQLPDLVQSEIVYTMAKRVFEEDRRMILDSTVGGKLEVFKKVELSSFLDM